MNHEGKFLLLVEDDENDVFFLQRALKKAGVELLLHVVSDGEQALQYLDGTGKYAERAVYPVPALIFLDLKLPYLSGFEVLEHIRKQPVLGGIQVVVLTSSPEERDRKRAFELGAQEYLVKPATPEMLLEVLGHQSGSEMVKPGLPGSVTINSQQS